MKHKIKNYPFSFFPMGFLFFAPSVYAQNFSGGSTPLVHVERSKADERIQAEVGSGMFFGQNNRSNPQVLAPISADAKISVDAKSTLSCGQLSVGANITESLKRLNKIPKQLVEQFTDPKKLEQLGKSLPLLTLCYMSPTICAEAKNLQIHFEKDLSIQVDACKLIDDTISKQAESVRSARATQIRTCVENTTGTRDEDNITITSAGAYARCNAKNTETLLYTDLIKGFAEKNSTSERWVLSDLMKSINEGNISKVTFLQSLLGETHQDSNGERPELPNNRVKLTPEYIAKDVKLVAHHTFCDDGKLKGVLAGMPPLGIYSDVPQIAFMEEKQASIIKKNITTAQIRDLEDLEKPDRDLLCNAFGKSIASLTLRELATEMESSMGAALGNPALEPQLADTYSKRVASASASLRNEAEQTKDVSRLREIASRMAEITREEKRITAAHFSRGDAQFQQTVLERKNIPCTSVLTCK